MAGETVRDRDKEERGAGETQGKLLHSQLTNQIASFSCSELVLRRAHIAIALNKSADTKLRAPTAL